MSHKYILDIHKLHPGDIILTADSTKVSRIVRTGTLSKYSHAAIWVGGTMIEATLDGVFSKNPQRLLADKAQHIAVFRSKTPLSRDVVTKVCAYARSKVGSLYALSEATFMLPLRYSKSDESRRQFCSRLVACAYASSGYDLQNLRNPSFCSPRQLALCKAFRKVEGIVKVAHSDEVAFALSEDPIKVHLEHTFRWLNKVRSLVLEDHYLSKNFEIQTVEDVKPLLTAHPELDKKISGFMLSTEYLNFFNYDRKANPYRYDRILMLSMLSKIPLEAASRLDMEFEREVAEIERYGSNIATMAEYVEHYPLEYFAHILKLYRNLMCESYTRLEVIMFGFNSIGVAHRVVEARSLGRRACDYIKTANDQLVSEHR